MATIKLQPSGAVVLKDGKVACSCCAQPSECCMYPAEALADGLYTVDDLPDQIQIGPYTLQKGVAIAIFPVQVEGAFYGTLEDEEAYVYLANEAWNFGPAVGSGGQECLIDGNIVTDQFADSYTVTINPPDDNAGTYTVIRRSLCVWSTQVEESGEPAGLKLSYIDGVIFGEFAYTWEIELDTFYIKDGFANTPTGNYSGGIATVS